MGRMGLMRQMGQKFVWFVWFVVKNLRIEIKRICEMAVKPRIGNIVFEDMRGQMMPSYASDVDTFVRKGLDGVGYRTNAKRARAIEKTTREWVVADRDANDSSDVYSALKNTKVRVVEPSGREIADVLVLDVIVGELVRITSTYPTGYNWEVRATWYLQPTLRK
jgi:hypothetical protein